MNEMFGLIKRIPKSTEKPRRRLTTSHDTEKVSNIIIKKKNKSSKEINVTLMKYPSLMTHAT